MVRKLFHRLRMSLRRRNAEREMDRELQFHLEMETAENIFMRTMKEIVSASIAQRRFEMTLISAFAVVALLLGVIGVYGVVSLSVANRMREIGLRMALGASPLAVMRWVFARGLRPVFIGAFVGLFSAVTLATFLRSLLFTVEPTDPFALVAVALILLCASLLACYLPARRAAELNPADLLRS